MKEKYRMRYLYTKKNKRLLLLRLLLICKKSGIYLLSGKSGTGKSAFLRTVFEKKSKDVCWMNSEMVKQELIEHIKSGYSFTIEKDNSRYVILENMESILPGRNRAFCIGDSVVITGKQMEDAFIQYVDELYRSGHIVIITNGENQFDNIICRDECRIYHFFDNKVNEYAVKTFARWMCIRLSREEIIEVTNSGIPMYTLPALLRSKRLLQG